MLIVSIDGGLGNQMFEYAFYLALTEKYSSNECYIDLSLLNKGTHNGYELRNVFGIEAPEARIEDVARYSEYCPKQMKHSFAINQMNRIRRNICGEKKSYIVQKDSTEYYEEIFELDILKSYYMRGVWANTNYFRQIKEKVLGEFRFPAISGNGNEVLEKEIMNTNSIAVHFRKGDYVDFGFEVLAETYYHKAMEYMSATVASPLFFVFSDDIESAQRVIGRKDNYIYVTGNKGNDSYIDMQLMSLCKHNIIANSTFSFWGAYLNSNPDKKVIYPTTPLRGCRYPYADIDWIGIS